MQNETKVIALCQRLADAKATEQRANKDRVAIEAQIIELVGCPEEGAETHDAGGWKIKVDQRINRKIDERKYALVSDKIPEALRPVTVKESLTVETKGVRWLRDNEPGYYNLLCEAMTETPAKPSVKVEVSK